ncbi:hypothetical protein H2203_002410 [Taxawa tesnikishii (nom. ined.)]|nr:hypothetical protein H2203_002410 [Dothideales sp. JES 119]
MDTLLEQARSVWEGQIDFEGQRLADLLSTLLLSTAGFLAFIIGYVTQNIHNTLWIGLGGTAFTFLVVVPPWPFFNRNPTEGKCDNSMRGVYTDDPTMQRSYINN